MNEYSKQEEQMFSQLIFKTKKYNIQYVFHSTAALEMGHGHGTGVKVHSSMEFQLFSCKAKL